jgi:hypothetical protein
VQHPCRKQAQCGLLSFDLASLCLRVTADDYNWGKQQQQHRIPIRFLPHLAVQSTTGKVHKYLQMQMRHGVKPLFFPPLGVVWRRKRNLFVAESFTSEDVHIDLVVCWIAKGRGVRPVSSCLSYLYPELLACRFLLRWKYTEQRHLK